MNLFDIIARYFWLLCLVMSGFNYFAGERAAAKAGPASPRASDEARLPRSRFAVVAALPWVVMGTGMVIGGVPNVWHYFRPQDRNPYVLAWFGSVFFVVVAFAWWVFFRDGAAKAVAYQLFETLSPRSRMMQTSGRVKFFAALGPVWIASWTAMIVWMNAPVPH